MDRKKKGGSIPEGRMVFFLVFFWEGGSFPSQDYSKIININLLKILIF